MLHRRRLSSASTDRLDVPTCRLSTVGDGAFPVAGAKVWNGLPSDVTSASSLAVFKNRLKTYTCSAAAMKLFETAMKLFPSNFIPHRTVVLAIVSTIQATLKMLADDDDECSLLLLEIWCSVKNVASINKVSARGYVRYAQSPDIIHTARCYMLNMDTPLSVCSHVIISLCMLFAICVPYSSVYFLMYFNVRQDAIAFDLT